eukprot:scaffold22589_cov138-Cylindrotheca_fusiformis.AAC.16
MSPKSERLRLINQLRSILARRLANRSYRFLFEDIDGVDSFANAMDLVVAVRLSDLLNGKDIFRSNACKKGDPKVISIKRKHETERSNACKKGIPKVISIKRKHETESSQHYDTPDVKRRKTK